MKNVNTGIHGNKLTWGELAKQLNSVHRPRQAHIALANTVLIHFGFEMRLALNVNEPTHWNKCSNVSTTFF